MQALDRPYWRHAGLLVATVLFLHLTRLDRRTVASACFALFLVSSLLIRSFASNWLGVGWIALYAGFFIAPMSIRPRWAFWALVGILVSHALAIPGSIFWGDSNWVLTAGVVVWMAPALLLYLSDGTDRVWAFLVPAWLLHAGLIIYGGFTNWHWEQGILIRGEVPTGLSHNPNLAAGFLTLGIVYLMTTRARWLTPPLFVALLFTGSRWGLLVCAGVLLAMAARRTISWKPLAGGVAAALLGVTLVASFTPLPYHVAGFASVGEAMHGVSGDIGTRLAMPHLPSLLPRGVAEHPGLHNVPLRIAYENGIVAAVMWLAVTGWALTKQRGATAWWLLLTLTLLSTLDYYAWMGHLGGFWWLLVGLLVKRGRDGGDQGVPPS